MQTSRVVIKLRKRRLVTAPNIRKPQWGILHPQKGRHTLVPPPWMIKRTRVISDAAGKPFRTPSSATKREKTSSQKTHFADKKRRSSWEIKYQKKKHDRIAQKRAPNCWKKVRVLDLDMRNSGQKRERFN